MIGQKYLDQIKNTMEQNLKLTLEVENLKIQVKNTEKAEKAV